MCSVLRVKPGDQIRFLFMGSPSTGIVESLDVKFRKINIQLLGRGALSLSEDSLRDENGQPFNIEWPCD